MQATEKDQASAVNEIYQYAANMLVHENKSPLEVQNALIAQGLPEETAATVVENLENQIHDAHKEAARKDMLYGALWCVGGTVLTLANVGFIFWGAILFGGIQFLKGLFNTLK
jgi:alcohol dehydrogenase class IV